MRHGQRPILTNVSTPKSKLGTFLLVASVVKSLSSPGGTLNLDKIPIPLSDSLVLQVLRRNSLDLSKRIDFFHWCSLSHNYKHSAGAYTQLFKTLCLTPNIHTSLPQILHLLSSMKHDGISLDSPTFKLLLDSFIKSGKFDSALELLDHVEKELDMGTTETSLKPDVNNSILVALVRNNQLSIALTMFLKLFDSSTAGIEVAPSAIACNELLVALRKADMRSEFKNVFDKLRAKKIHFPLDVWGYNICIHAFGSWGDLGTCLNLFKEMKQKSVGMNGAYGPDLCTYNSLLQVLCFVGKVKDALAVWDELKGSGHEPDIFSYRIIIQGCCKSYRMNDATKIFSEMQYNGFRPDTVVYNSVMDGFLKAKKLTEACQLFEKMVDDGVRASCWTYNILIDGLFRNGRPQAAYVLFGDLKRKGKFVDGITYSIVISHICREGMLEEALKLVEEMEARGFAVDLVTITSFLVAIYKQGRLDLTDRLVKHIRDGNLMLNVIKWKTSMEASLKNPQSREKDLTPMFPAKTDFTKILSLLSSGDRNEMENSKHDTDQWSSSPYMDLLANKVKSTKLLFTMSRGKRVQDRGMNSFDSDMVNTYMSIFLAKGKLSIACKLFEILTNLGVDPVSYTYNSMMSSFVKKGYSDEAYGILHEMGENFCPVDIATYNVMIQGMGHIGRADLASAVLDILMKEGYYLDIVMYNTLINALGKAGRFDEANRLFQQMKSSGINPDVVTYNTLIEVHGKAGQVKEAYRFLKMMLDAGCVPNHVTDTILDFLDKQVTNIKSQKVSMKRPKGNHLHSQSFDEQMESIFTLIHLAETRLGFGIPLIGSICSRPFLKPLKDFVVGDVFPPHVGLSTLAVQLEFQLCLLWM